MATTLKRQICELAGCVVVREEYLPDGIGVFPDEVGKPGPWYGVRLPSGEVLGWERGSDVPACSRMALERMGILGTGRTRTCHTLSCGHPSCCLATGDEGAAYCRWCEEVGRALAGGMRQIGPWGGTE